MTRKLRGARVALVAFAAFAALGVPGPAASADKDKAREHYRKGSALYTLEKYDQSIGEFEAGYAEAPDPVFLYNIAQAHRLAHRTEQAIQFYKKYLDKSPEAPNRREVEDYVASLERSAAPTGVMAAPAEKRPLAVKPPPADPVARARPVPPPKTAPKEPAKAPPPPEQPQAATPALQAPPPEAIVAPENSVAKAAAPRRWPLFVGVGVGAGVLVVAAVVVGVIFGARSSVPTFEWSAR